MTAALGPLPTPAARAADRARRALAAAAYTEAGLSALLGPRDLALSPAEQESLWLWRARGSAPLALLARLFLLGQPVARGPLVAALGPPAVAAFGALGLIRENGPRVAPRVQLSIHGGLLVPSDADPARGAPPADHVLGPTTATLLLDRLTFRRPVRRALDLGTGTGYLALRLTRHAETVVGADVSPRALAYARLGAALNGVRSISWRASDRFAACGARRFDLVVGNLPFVISPERRFVYRDSGAPADGFLEAVVRESGRHLEEGGFAQYLGQWVHRAGESEDERLAPWIVASGCDALVLRLEREPVDRYAARWLAGPLPLSRAARARRLAAWLAHYQRARIDMISTGLWLLRRRRAARHFMAIEELPGGEIPTAADVYERFSALARTA